MAKVSSPHRLGGVVNRFAPSALHLGPPFAVKLEHESQRIYSSWQFRHTQEFRKDAVPPQALW